MIFLWHIENSVVPLSSMRALRPNGCHCPGHVAFFPFPRIRDVPIVFPWFLRCFGGCFCDKCHVIFHHVRAGSLPKGAAVITVSRASRCRDHFWILRVPR